MQVRIKENAHRNVARTQRTGLIATPPPPPQIPSKFLIETKGKPGGKTKGKPGSKKDQPLPLNSGHYIS